jgi:hypothetical protein
MQISIFKYYKVIRRKLPVTFKAKWREKKIGILKEKDNYFEKHETLYLSKKSI